MTAASLDLSVNGAIASLVFRNPERMNALTFDMWQALPKEIARAESNPDVRVLTVTGSGETAFCAGADISELAALSATDAKEQSRLGQQTFDVIEHMGKPVIAAVSGYALGGGCELAMMTDIVLAADTAKFSQPEITLGIIPGCGGTQRLVRAVGKAKANVAQRGLAPMAARSDKFTAKHLCPSCRGSACAKKCRPSMSMSVDTANTLLGCT